MLHILGFTGMSARCASFQCRHVRGDNVLEGTVTEIHAQPYSHVGQRQKRTSLNNIKSNAQSFTK